MKRCRVRGRQLYADGRPCLDTISVTPGRAAIVDGNIYSADPIEVTVRSDGSFQVELAPSRFAGVYTFVLHNGVFKVRVPEENEFTIAGGMA